MRDGRILLPIRPVPVYDVRFPSSFGYLITLVKAQRENVPQQAIKGHMEKEMAHPPQK